MDNGDNFEKPIDDVAFGKGTFGGLQKAEDFAAHVFKDRDKPEFAPISRESGNVDVGGESRRAAIVTRYRSGSITETHLDPDGSLGGHGAYHYSKREDTCYALKRGDRGAGRELRGRLIEK